MGAHGAAWRYFDSPGWNELGSCPWTQSLGDTGRGFSFPQKSPKEVNSREHLSSSASQNIAPAFSKPVWRKRHFFSAYWRSGSRAGWGTKCPHWIVASAAHITALGRPHLHTRGLFWANKPLHEPGIRQMGVGQDSCREERMGLALWRRPHQDSITACGCCFYIIKHKRMLTVIKHQRMQYKSSH